MTRVQHIWQLYLSYMKTALIAGIIGTILLLIYFAYQSFGIIVPIIVVVSIIGCLYSFLTSSWAKDVIMYSMKASMNLGSISSINTRKRESSKSRLKQIEAIIELESKRTNLGPPIQWKQEVHASLLRDLSQADLEAIKVIYQKLEETEYEHQLRIQRMTIIELIRIHFGIEEHSLDTKLNIFREQHRLWKERWDKLLETNRIVREKLRQVLDQMEEESSEYKHSSSKRKFDPNSKRDLDLPTTSSNDQPKRDSNL